MGELPEQMCGEDACTWVMAPAPHASSASFPSAQGAIMGCCVHVLKICQQGCVGVRTSYLFFPQTREPHKVILACPSCRLHTVCEVGMGSCVESTHDNWSGCLAVGHVSDALWRSVWTGVVYTPAHTPAGCTPGLRPHHKEFLHFETMAAQRNL